MRQADLGSVVTVAIDGETSRLALVLDPHKPAPQYWKFPGGGIEEEDVDRGHPYDDDLTADNAAKRETEEETGLKVKIVRLGRIQKKTHSVYVRLGLADFRSLAPKGKEGEFVKAYSLDELYQLLDFFHNHKAILGMALNHLGVPTRRW
jgi:8-oxo-dGTP pyrophosphatase MutT (NUDIX family)